MRATAGTNSSVAMKDPFLRQQRCADRVSTTIKADALPRPAPPARYTPLFTQSDSVNRVVVIQQYEVVATACNDGNVRVYSYDTRGDPVHVMSAHSDTVEDMAHVGGDVLVTTGADGMLITWSALKGKPLEAMKLEERAVRAVAALPSGDIVVGTMCGDLIFITHANGRKLERGARVHRAHSCQIFDLVSKAGVLLTLADDWAVGVWDATTRARRAILAHSHWVMCASATRERIATVNKSELRIYRNGDDYALQAVIRGLHSADMLFAVAFAAPTVVMTGGADGMLAFASVDSPHSAVARVRTSCNGIWDAALMSDGRVVVAERGDCENAIIELPQPVLDIVAPSADDTRRRFSRHAVTLLAASLAATAFALARSRR